MQTCSLCGKNKSVDSIDFINKDEELDKSFNETVYICESCLKITEDNFVVFCVGCGSSFKINKEEALQNMAVTEGMSDMYEEFNESRGDQTLTIVHNCLVCSKDINLETTGGSC